MEAVLQIAAVAVQIVVRNTVEILVIIIAELFVA